MKYLKAKRTDESDELLNNTDRDVDDILNEEKAKGLLAAIVQTLENQYPLEHFEQLQEMNKREE